MREAQQSSRALVVGLRRAAERAAEAGQDPDDGPVGALVMAADYADDCLRALIEAEHHIWRARLRGLDEEEKK